MKEYDINKLLEDIDFKRNKLVKVNNELLLTNYQISILERFNINYQNASSLKSIIYELEEVLEETDDEEVEIVLDQLTERNYYENTKK